MSGLKEGSVVIQLGSVNENQPTKRYVIRNIHMRWFLAEFFGTCLLIFMCTSINMQYLLLRKESSPDATIWGCGLTVTMCVYATFGVSGGHINPAVTMAFYVMGRMDVKSLLVYWSAQYMGSFVGATITYLVYYEAFHHYDQGAKLVLGVNATASIWASYPPETHHVLTSFVDPVVGTAMLMIFVLGIVDPKNTPISRSVQPLLIGLVIVTILTGLSYNSGACINPARDFGPRLFSALAGWGIKVFTANNYFFWIPIVCPHIGAMLGSGLYQVFIALHEPPYEEDIEPVEERYMQLAVTEPKKSDVSLAEKVRLSAADKQIKPLY